MLFTVATVEGDRRVKEALSPSAQSGSGGRKSVAGSPNENWVHSNLGLEGGRGQEGAPRGGGFTVPCCHPLGQVVENKHV